MTPSSMTDAHKASIARIQKACRLIRLGCRVAIIMQVISLILLPLILFVPPHFFKESMAKAGLGTLSDQSLRHLVILAVVFGVATVLLSLKGFSHLTRLMECYAQGTFFAEEVVRQYQRIGWVFLGYAAVGLIGYIAELAVTTMEKITLPPSLESPPGSVINSAAFGALLIVLSWVMDEGRRLREEQELTV